MATLEFKFELDEHTGIHEPIVRIWADVDRDRTLEHDEELDVTREADSLKFTAKRTVPDDNVEGMPFRLRHLATVGAKWTMKITADGETVFEGKDEVIHMISGMGGTLRIKKKEAKPAGSEETPQ